MKKRGPKQYVVEGNRLRTSRNKGAASMITDITDAYAENSKVYGKRNTMMIRAKLGLQGAWVLFFFEPVSHYGVAANRSRDTALGCNFV
jgi:hypothetical protein